MNTLSRALTARFFLTADDYTAFQAHWRALLRSERRHDLAAAHHLLYAALLGRDWRKGFTPITNRRKLDNGAFHGWGLFPALYALHSQTCEAWLLAPFAGLVTPDMLHQVRALVPLVGVYAYRPDDFTPGAFPFDAYSGPAASPARTPDHAHA
jgi:hypothetical protein